MLSISQNASFRYCPSCGSDLSVNHTFKFCPFCGNSLPCGIKDAAAVNALPEYGMKENNQDNRQNVDNYNESEYYSIVLKHAVDRQRLINKLEKVLLRSFLAIRMAVENIPSLIVFKGKVKDMMPVLTSFSEEYASISILPGEYNTELKINQIISDYNQLGTYEQQILERVPAKLWIGDTDFHLFFADYDSMPGFFILSDQNLYYVSKTKKETVDDWMVCSYYLINEIKIEEDQIVLFLSSGATYSFKFSYQDKATKVGQLLLKKQKAFSNHMLTRCICDSCGFVLDANIFERLEHTLCKKCGTQLECRLLFK